MMVFVLKCIYLMLPGGFANMAPVLFRGLFKTKPMPVDMGIKLWGKPLFGSHKSYRGFFLGIASSILVAYLQTALYGFGFFKSISFIDYSQQSFVILGLLMGFGTLFGDLVKSFFKRRLNIAPGARFFPWDQIDWMAGLILFTYLVYPLSLEMIITLFVLAILLHILTKHIGYFAKIDKERW